MVKHTREGAIVSRHRMSFAGNYAVASPGKLACGWFYEMLILFGWFWFAASAGISLGLPWYHRFVEPTRDGIFWSDELSVVAGFMIVWALATTTLSVITGMTLGKVLAGTKVVKLDGTNAGPGRMLLRDFVGKGLFIPFIAPFLWLVNAFTVYGSDENRGMWDQMAKTMVVERN